MKLHPSRCWRAFALAFSAAALAARPARASIVAQDDFDTYVPGDINGLNGGNNGTSSALGWTGAWSAASGVTVSLDTIKYPIAGTSPVEYLALGQSLKVAANGNNVVTRTLPDSGGADRYVSFYFEIKNGGTDNSPVGGTIFAGWQALDSAGSSTNYTAGLLGVSGKAGARVGDTSVTGGRQPVSFRSSALQQRLLRRHPLRWLVWRSLSAVPDLAQSRQPKQHQPDLDDHHIRSGIGGIRRAAAAHPESRRERLLSLRQSPRRHRMERRGRHARRRRLLG